MSVQQFLRENAIFGQLDRAGYSVADLMPVFPGDTLNEVIQRLRDNALRYRRTVERFGYLGTRECTSRYFNVWSGRFRRSLNSHTPAESSSSVIHCYGGSTTSGHNVGDEETFPHYLEIELLKTFKSLTVLNFGAGNHTSLHASLCLLDHCLSGVVPRVAIMLHGVNDVIYADSGGDGALPFLDKALMLSQHSPGNQTPIGELSSLIPKRDVANPHLDNAGDSNFLAFMREQISETISVANAISEFCASRWGVEVIRFWEPTPFLHCRPEQDPFPRLRQGDSTYLKAEAMFRNIHDFGLANSLGLHNYKDLSDCGQSNLDGALFVDQLHYSPLMNRHIATNVAASIKEAFAPVQVDFPRGGQRLSLREFGSSRKRMRLRATSGSSSESNLYPLW